MSLDPTTTSLSIINRGEAKTITTNSPVAPSTDEVHKHVPRSHESHQVRAPPLAKRSPPNDILHQPTPNTCTASCQEKEAHHDIPCLSHWSPRLPMHCVEQTWVYTTRKSHQNLSTTKMHHNFNIAAAATTTYRHDHPQLNQCLCHVEQ